MQPLHRVQLFCNRLLRPCLLGNFPMCILQVCLQLLELPLTVLVRLQVRSKLVVLGTAQISTFVRAVTACVPCPMSHGVWLAMLGVISCKSCCQKSMPLTAHNTNCSLVSGLHIWHLLALQTNADDVNFDTWYSLYQAVHVCLHDRTSYEATPKVAHPPQAPSQLFFLSCAPRKSP